LIEKNKKEMSANPVPHNATAMDTSQIVRLPESNDANLAACSSNSPAANDLNDRFAAPSGYLRSAMKALRIEPPETDVIVCTF
jgi:hypothetical protein